MNVAHKPSTRFAATIDAETAVLYDRAERALVSANPALEGEITPTMMLRQGLRAIVAQYGGGAGASPSSPAPAPAPAPVEPPVQVQPAARVEEPRVEPAPPAAAPPSKRVDRAPKAPKRKAAAKPARPSTRGKAPAPTAPDPRQLGIPGADGIASTGGSSAVEPAPVEGKVRRVAASPGDVERIAEYLTTPGALGALALSQRAGVPGAKSSLFAIQGAKRRGEPLPGLSATNAAAIIACINELPRAQSAAAVARGSQGEETPNHG